jgi:hypothetical protein
MWNHRVEITEITETEEFCASIVEVYYEPNSVGSTEEITPMGAGKTKQEAILALKEELELMLESVNFVLEGKTSVYDLLDRSTHTPGAESVIAKEYEARYGGIDPDDAYMDEQNEE